MLIKKLNRICGYISGTFIVLSAVVMLYDVICRYLFDSPSLYAPFAAAFLILGAIFFGAGYSFQAGGQVYVEIVIDRLPRLPRRISLTVGYIFSIVFLGALAKSCWDLMGKAAVGHWKAQGNLAVPSVILYGIMVGGIILMIVTIIIKVASVWRGSGDEKGKKGELK